MGGGYGLVTGAAQAGTAGSTVTPRSAGHADVGFEWPVAAPGRAAGPVRVPRPPSPGLPGHIVFKEFPS
jgi:hypothetical protein